MTNGVTYLRREPMTWLVRAFDAGTIGAEIDRIAVTLRPKDGPSTLCCVYHDRAVIKSRLLALLGASVEDEEGELKRLSEYYAEKVSGDAEQGGGKPEATDEAPLTVCGAMCSGCPAVRVVSLPNCRGCIARPCEFNCPKQAIKVVNGKSVVDQERCIKCGKCITACPYHAIVKTTVPCEDACPVGAIRKNEAGIAEIDFNRCIACGNCLNACPFSAVVERSQLLDVLLAMKRGERVVAMVAPSAEGQFPGTVEQLFTACSKAGFADIIEVALGAEMTTAHETEEFVERMTRDPQTFMTTSCCPSYVNLVAKHLPELAKHVSETPSPMVYTRDLVRTKEPAAKVVFIGPCVAKRVEARQKGVDYVLSFEELGAIFEGRNIDVAACEPWPLPRPAAKTARNFARSCGVTEAVLAEATAKIPGFQLNAKQINGIDKKSCALLKLYAAGKLPANFLEVMSCPGGCVNGPGSITRMDSKEK